MNQPTQVPPTQTDRHEPIVEVEILVNGKPVTVRNGSRAPRSRPRQKFPRLRPLPRPWPQGDPDRR